MGVDRTVRTIEQVMFGAFADNIVEFIRDAAGVAVKLAQRTRITHFATSNVGTPEIVVEVIVTNRSPGAGSVDL